MMNYVIKVYGIGDKEIATRLAKKLDSNGQAKAAGIRIVIIPTSPSGLIDYEPIWSNDQ